MGEPSQSNENRKRSLEYYVEIPSPTTRKECFSAFPNATAPVVLLLGWAGCQDRYLMKYSKIYENKGLITVRYTAPVEHIFWKRDAMRPLGQKIVKMLHEANFDTHPILIHLFSNGGAYLYQHIDLAIRDLQSPIHICGVVFDSAPGDRRLLGLFRAISNIYGKDRRCSGLVSCVITLGMAIRWVLEDLYKIVKGLFRSSVLVETNPYVNLQALPELIPQLFLYSDEDKLIPAVDVEKFANHRKLLGAPVDTVCFSGAEHVKLYIQDPDKYVHHLYKFIDKCLQDEKK